MQGDAEIGADVGLILLAAGQSSRFRGRKLDAELGGRAVIDWAIEAAEAAGFSRKFIVVREDEKSRQKNQGWQQVVNPDAVQGISTSIKAGVAAAKECKQVVIILADMPRVTANHLVRLADYGGVVFTHYADGRRGCPAAFPHSAFPTLLTLQGDRGAASLDFADASAITPDKVGMLVDIDTRSDLALACAQVATNER